MALRCDYRTDMTIAPSPPHSSTSSSTNTNPNTIRSQPIMLKSDHFDNNNPGKTFFRTGAISDESSEQNVTSDESQDAVRIFAASPPDPYPIPTDQHTPTT